ncbi:MAG: hypothetical protein HC780_23165 [Leptolyngbyaceae cyanobacterium CSU_1_3]|nr:hypothetical protein [Leptolyngbyaceae cyanobacterium CSU_1_3]
MTDFAFIVFHFLYEYTVLSKNPLLHISRDGGYAELFQYLKEFWSIALLSFLAIQTRSRSYLSWSSFFCYLLIDDSLSIHERLGDFIAEKLAFSALLKLRPVDFGELLVFGVSGLFFLTLIAIAYYLGDSFFRRASRKLIMLLLVLAFFGVAVDMLHVVFKFSRFEPLFSVLEDGGEMVVMSVMMCFIFSLSGRIQEGTNTTEIAEGKPLTQVVKMKRNSQTW